MSIAKKAVDSTLRKILIYTAEIIASIILLVMICIPLLFTIPMWFQHVLFETPSSELWFNPILIFGAGGAVWVTMILGLVSIIITYPTVMKMIPGGSPSEEPTAEEKEEDVEPDIESDDIEEEEEEESEDETEE